MKNLVIAITLIFGLQTYAQESIKLKEGTIVKALLVYDINGKYLKIGDKLEFNLAEPLFVDGKKVAGIDSKIVGTVTDASSSKMLGKKGSLAFTIDNLYMPGDEIVKLTNSTAKQMQGSGAAVVAGSILLTPFALFIHGKNAKYKAGTVFDTYVAETIDVKLTE